MGQYDFQRLVDALAEGRAAGFHIDLQNYFHGALTAMAFPEANKVVQNLRAHDIRNYWVLMAGGWGVSSYKQFCRESEDRQLRIHGSLDVDEEDLVFKKDEQWLFGLYGIKSEMILKTSDIDTLVVTGVKHNLCVHDTVAGALQRAFKVYVVADATDRPMGDFDSFEHDLGAGLTSDEKDRLCVIDTLTLDRALFSARDKAAPVLS